jgi:hypothetical protein
VKASYDTSVQRFTEAALRSERDEISDFTSSTALGNMCRLGTGCVDLLLDQSFLDEHAPYQMTLEDAYAHATNELFFEPEEPMMEFAYAGPDSSRDPILFDYAE